MHEKRNVESAIHTLQAEIDDCLGQAKNSEEKSKRAMVDGARLAVELRAEQDHANSEERNNRALETQLAELETRMADAEASTMASSRAAMSKYAVLVFSLIIALCKNSLTL